jgi:hypothetical protein
MYLARKKPSKKILDMKDLLPIEFMLDFKLAERLEAHRVSRGTPKNLLFDEIIRDYLDRQPLPARENEVETILKTHPPKP